MPWRQQDNPTGLERVISVLCYLTAGIAGILYIIISRSSYQSNFFRFHFMQSIILGLIALLLSWANGFFTGTMIPLLTITFFQLLDGLMPGTGGMIANGIVMLVQAIIVAFGLLPVYGLIFAALGKYAEIPFISNVVRQQMR